MKQRVFRNTIDFFSLERVSEGSWSFTRVLPLTVSRFDSFSVKEAIKKKKLGFLTRPRWNLQNTTRSTKSNDLPQSEKHRLTTNRTHRISVERYFERKETFPRQFEILYLRIEEEKKSPFLFPFLLSNETRELQRRQSKSMIKQKLENESRKIVGRVSNAGTHVQQFYGIMQICV